LTEQQMQPFPTSNHSVTCLPSWFTDKDFSISLAAGRKEISSEHGTGKDEILRPMYGTVHTVSELWKYKLAGGVKDITSITRTGRRAIHDYRNPLAMLLREDIVEQRSLPRSQVAYSRACMTVSESRHQL